MSESTFWSLIALFNWAATSDEAVVEPVVDSLASMTIEEIYAFDDILTDKLYALDTRDHAQEIGEYAYGEGYFSVDLFLYARCAVVANGQSLYDAVLANPTKFPNDIEFEALLYVAQTAFERKTGQDYSHLPELSYETFANKAGWP